MFHPCLPENHDWAPIHGWSARYKCSICYSVGYRGVVVELEGKRHLILEYRCTECHGPTTLKQKPCPICQPREPRKPSEPSRPRRTLRDFDRLRG